MGKHAELKRYLDKRRPKLCACYEILFKAGCAVSIQDVGLVFTWPFSFWPWSRSKSAVERRLHHLGITGEQIRPYPMDIDKQTKLLYGDMQRFFGVSGDKGNGCEKPASPRRQARLAHAAGAKKGKGPKTAARKGQTNNNRKQTRKAN
jgi:hypothetical protein